MHHRLDELSWSSVDIWLRQWRKLNDINEVVVIGSRMTRLTQMPSHQLVQMMSASWELSNVSIKMIRYSNDCVDLYAPWPSYSIRETFNVPVHFSSPQLASLGWHKDKHGDSQHRQVDDLTIWSNKSLDAVYSLQAGPINHNTPGFDQDKEAIKLSVCQQCLQYLPDFDISNNRNHGSSMSMWSRQIISPNNSLTRIGSLSLWQVQVDDRISIFHKLYMASFWFPAGWHERQSFIVHTVFGKWCCSTRIFLQKLRKQNGSHWWKIGAVGQLFCCTSGRIWLETNWYRRCSSLDK